MVVGRLMHFVEVFASSVSWRIVRLLLTFCLLAHWIGCAFYILSYEQYQTPPDTSSWYKEKFAGRDSTLLTKWLQSYYVAVKVLVGEDIAPNTNSETFFVIVFEILGACFYATLFGQVALLVQNFNRSSSRYQEKMDEVNTFMKLYKLPTDVRKRVRNYYDYSFQSLEGQKVTADLTESLKTEIFVIQYLDMISKIKMFQGRFALLSAPKPC